MLIWKRLIPKLHNIGRRETPRTRLMVEQLRTTALGRRSASIAVAPGA
jgi:hypothetical protein